MKYFIAPILVLASFFASAEDFAGATGASGASGSVGTISFGTNSSAFVLTNIVIDNGTVITDSVSTGGTGTYTATGANYFNFQMPVFPSFNK